MLKNKRGVGAIIAWVLLLGFTVALATMIFLWMKGQTETMSESTVEYVEGELQCQSVRINVVNTTGPICENPDVHNVGYLNIKAVVVREICTDGSATSSKEPHSINLQPKSSKTETLGEYKTTLSGFCSGGADSCLLIIGCKKIEVMPILKIGERLVGCKDRTIVVEC